MRAGAGEAVTRRRVAACAALLLALAAYSNSFQNSFHFDDSHVVQTNVYIRSLTNAARFFQDASTFSSEPRNATYRPLVSLSLAVDYRLGNGLDPFAFHVSQWVMLLLLGALTAWFYARLLSAAGFQQVSWELALCASALFALHTTATETMNLMHARSELLSAMGVVGAFLLYLRAPGLRGVLLALVPMTVGALAKVPAVIFAPLLGAYIWLFEEQQPLEALLTRGGWPALKRTALRVLPALVVGAGVFMWIESMNAPGATYGGGDRLTYLRTQMFVWLHYARLFVLPVGLTADTDWGLIGPWYDTRVVVGALFVVGLVRLAWVSSRTKELRPVAFGVAWFILCLLPASSIFPLAEVANEHRVFLPYIGASLAVVSGGAWLVRSAGGRWPDRRRALEAAALALALLALVANAVGTYVRNRTWKTEETLWRDVTEKSPGNGRALMNYGVTQMGQARYVEAKALFDRALPLLPAYPTLEVNLGVVTGHLGKREEATAHFLRAIALAPRDVSSRVFYARWLLQQGMAGEAIPHLALALQVSPGQLDARYLLMKAYARTQNPTALQALARETLAIAPEDSVARRYLDHPGDVDALERATAVQVDVSRFAGKTLIQYSDAPAPAAGGDPYRAALDSSLAAYLQKDYARALELAHRALALNPASAEAHNNIAAAHAALGRWDEAITASERALALRPDFELARNNRAWALAEKQKQQNGPARAGNPQAPTP